jgi:hypothetical protein
VVVLLPALLQAAKDLDQEHREIFYIRLADSPQIIKKLYLHDLNH